jgi:hypothetical protein
MSDITCLQCRSVRVHRSRRRHPAERVLTFLGGSLRRCHDCNSRYVRFGGSLVRLTDLRRISERILLALTMAVAAALILVAIVWFNRSQATPADDTSRMDAPWPRSLRQDLLPVIRQGPSEPSRISEHRRRV